MSIRSVIWVFALMAAAAIPTQLLADCIPYCNVGSEAPIHSYFAIDSGWITGTFYGGIADFEDLALLYDWTTGTLSDTFFDNHNSNQNDMVDVLEVNAGDLVSVLIYDVVTGRLYDSEVLALNADGLNHAYGTDSDRGVFIGLEDLAQFENADFDYDDLEFYLSNVTIADWVPPTSGRLPEIPEPATLLLVGSGLLAIRAMKGT